MNLVEQIDIMANSDTSTKDESKTYISTGNALADEILGGGLGPIGKLVQIAAPSGAGKTVLCNEAIFQAMKKYGKDNVSVRYVDKEGGNSFDTESMYGFSLQGCFAEDVDTVQDLSADLHIFAESKPEKNIGIYVVDSWDSLASDDEMIEMSERVKYYKKGQEYDKKTYGADKAKYTSKFFRTLIKTIRDSNVLMIVISQLRDNLNAGMFGPKDLIGGGRALEFYADQRLSLRVREEIKEENRLIGQTVMLNALKTRCKYPKRSTFLTLLTAYGIDDVGTNVDYLYDLRDDLGKLKTSDAANIVWGDRDIEVNSNTVKAFLEENGVLDDALSAIKDDKKRATQNNLIEWIRSNPEIQTKYVEYFGVLDRESLIQYIMDNDKEQEIADKAVKKWLNIEERIRPVRKEKRL